MPVSHADSTLGHESQIRGGIARVGIGIAREVFKLHRPL